MISMEYCHSLDAKDTLRELRQEFELPDGVIYLDGNSLGARPKAALARALDVVQREWGHDLIQSWNSAGWFEAPSRLGNQLAPLIGAQKDEVVVTDTTSTNLFKALSAALAMQSSDPQRKRIISERSNFPTDLYIAQGLSKWLDRGYTLHLIDDPSELEAALNQETAVVMLTHVNYRTGYMHNMMSVTQLCHQHGVKVIWDLAHSAGAVPINLNEAQADFAVGCTYKYLNGGPGSPAFIWVPQRHQHAFHHPLSGWWGHAQPFAMQAEFQPINGIRRALCGTQPIVSLSLVESGLAIFHKTNMDAIRKKSLALTDLFMALIRQECAHHKIDIVTPESHTHRGSQVSLSHPHAYALVQALIKRGVIGDYRDPGIMRFGFTPLYTSFGDVWHAVANLKHILDTNDYDLHIKRNAVT